MQDSVFNAQLTVAVSRFSSAGFFVRLSHCLLQPSAAPQANHGVPGWLLRLPVPLLTTYYKYTNSPTWTSPLNASLANQL
jgi:hypothetical protein